MIKIEASLYSPEKMFLIFSIFYGLSILFITPPFQVPDEFNHYYRILQISEGKFIPEKNAQKVLGGRIPKNAVFNDTIFAGLPFHPENKVKFYDTVSYLNDRINNKEKIFVEFPNTAIHFPLAYFPQLIGIFIGKIFDLSPILMLFFGRIFNLAVWVILIYYAIKFCPIKKWLIFLLALTPMSIFQAASLSTDNFTNAVSFLLLSLILHYSNDDNILTKEKYFILFILTACLVLAKTAVYFPIIFSFFLIPAWKTHGKKNLVVSQFLLVLIPLLLVTAWTMTWGTHNPYAGLRESNPAPAEQLTYIIKNPILFTKTMLTTIHSNFDFYCHSFIGRLGWLDVSLPRNFPHLYILILLTISLINFDTENYRIIYNKRWLIILIALLCIIQIHTMLYLTWTSVGKNVIEGVQGRYFIPFSFLSFLALANGRFNLIKYKTYFTVGIFIFANLSLITTLYFLVKRYY